MNRSKLKWFAGGAATASLMAILGLFLSNSLRKPVEGNYLEIWDAEFTNEASNGEEAEFPHVVKMLSECGATKYELVEAISSLRARIYIQNLSEDSFDCLLNRARAKELQMDLLIEKSQFQLVKAPIDRTYF